MKRIFLFVLVLLTGLVVLCSCSGKDQQSPPAVKSEPIPSHPSGPPPPAVGEEVYASFMQVPNHFIELAKVVEIKGDETRIAWNDTWTKKGNEVETRKLSEIYRFKPLTKEEAVVGCPVIINPKGFNSMVNYPGEIKAVKGELYTVSYNSGGTPQVEDCPLSKLLKLVK